MTCSPKDGLILRSEDLKVIGLSNRIELLYYFFAVFDTVIHTQSPHCVRYL